MGSLLCIDVGNTSLTLGLFKGKRIVYRDRISSKSTTQSELFDLFSHPKFAKHLPEGIAISSVVPRANQNLKKVCKKVFNIEPFFVNWKTAGVPIKGCIPSEVGADRLVNAVAAYERYGKELIVIDFGTATTFDYITPNGAFAGGSISPGIELANQSLSENTARLPEVPIKKTRKVIGTSTKEVMQSGVYHGYVGLTDHLVDLMSQESKTSPMVIATGGYAKLIASSSKTIEKVHPDLTLEGLKLIWEQSHI